MQHVRDSFDRQGFMRSIGAVLVTITCPFSDAITQQHGLIHGGVTASLADVACGYAAMSLMPGHMEVLTVEFKVNFLNPARTDRIIAVAKVIQAGRTLSVCEATVFDSSRNLMIAKMTATMMAVEHRKRRSPINTD